MGTSFSCVGGCVYPRMSLEVIREAKFVSTLSMELK